MALPLRYASIAVSSSGNNAVVAAVTGKSIVVMQYWLSANAAVNAKWQDDGAGTPTDLTGLLYADAKGGVTCPFSPGGIFTTRSGKSLDLNLSGAQAVGGSVVYVLA
jgi:hypothetical protein